MSGKGSGRRRENTALVEANWPFPDRKKDQALVESMRAENLHNAQMGHGRAVQASGSNPDKVGSIPTAPATFEVFEDKGADVLDAYFSANPGAWTEFLAAQPTTTYVDDDSGQAVTEAWWPGDPVPERE